MLKLIPLFFFLVIVPPQYFILTPFWKVSMVDAHTFVQENIIVDEIELVKISSNVCEISKRKFKATLTFEDSDQHSVIVKEGQVMICEKEQNKFYLIDTLTSFNSNSVTFTYNLKKNEYIIITGVNIPSYVYKMISN